MARELMGTLVGRWYVSVFGIVFLVLAVRDLGWRRTAVYSVVAVMVGALAENGSVHFGFPYTRYAFNERLRGDELFVGDVPLMVSLSYTFMAYFAFGAARLMVSGPYRTRAEMPVLEYLTGVMLAVWALWIVDPVSRLGTHFFLGELFRYDGAGFWFGLPLASQLGFAATSAILIGMLTLLARREPVRGVARLRGHPRLPAMGAYVGQVLFMAVTAFVVARVNEDPAVVRRADALAGATIVVGFPAVLLTGLHWRSLTVERSRDRDPAPDL
ncbi:MAG: carotenoid biosynthesis protein [Acidimicrobiia bacterium]